MMLGRLQVLWTLMPISMFLMSRLCMMLLRAADGKNGEDRWMGFEMVLCTSKWKAYATTCYYIEDFKRSHAFVIYRSIDPKKTCCFFPIFTTLPTDKIKGTSHRALTLPIPSLAEFGMWAYNVR